MWVQLCQFSFDIGRRIVGVKIFDLTGYVDCKVPVFLGNVGP